MGLFVGRQTVGDCTISRTLREPPTIGILTALTQEHSAVARLLQDARTQTIPSDPQRYKVGRVGDHKVVLAVLSGYGNNTAAAVTTNLLRSFTTVDYVVFVGIAAGIPRPAEVGKHVRLGDVVISDGKGVVQYDFGAQKSKQFVSMAVPIPPSNRLLQTVMHIESLCQQGMLSWSHELQSFLTCAGVKRPGREPRKGFRHPVDRSRSKNVPRISRGRIGAGNVLMKSARHRDQFAAEHDLLVLEMEGSGLADAVWTLEKGYLVIRAACDYGDENKGYSWQRYAAHVAAAYLGILLRHLPNPEMPSVDHQPGPMVNPLGLCGIDAVRQLEVQGQWLAAQRLLVSKWRMVKSWPNLVHFLRLNELAGGSERGLEQHSELRDAMSGKPPAPIAAAERYYLGRIRGQVGLALEALHLHSQNVGMAGEDNIYTIKSGFEVGQLQFRCEDFAAAKTTLFKLWGAVEASSDLPRSLLVDVLKFLATFETLHVIFDVPHAGVCLGDWESGTSQRSLELANQAIEQAHEAAYVDGHGWGLVVRSFGWEASGRPEEAERDLEEAARVLGVTGANPHSLVYSHLYRAGLELRRNELEAAEASLRRAELAIPEWNRTPYEADVLQRRSMLEFAAGRQAEGRRDLRHALELFARDRALRHRFEWPKVKRMKAISREYGWDFTEFFREKIATNPQ